MTDYRRLGHTDITTEVKQLLIDIHDIAFGDEMDNPFHQRFGWFVEHWSARDDFACVIGYDRENAIGFAYGAPATPGKEWWRPHWSPDGEETSTFHFSELAVLPRARKTGEGQRLHDTLLENREEAYSTLLVDTTHTKVIARYKEWGYASVGADRQFPDSPIYEVMVKTLMKDSGAG